MTNEQVKRFQELTRMMMLDICTKAAESEYWMLSNLEHEEYRKENEPKLIQFYKEHIEGKKWEDIRQEDWDWYSDWHKDVYGFRPRMY